MLQGEKIHLRRLEPTDIDFIMQWVNDPEVTKWLSSFVWPVSRKSEEEWLDRASKADNPSDQILAVERCV